MSSKLIPSNPADVMVIRDISPNIVTFSVPFLRFGTFKIGGRATLVKLTSGDLLIFSPIALTDEVKAKVASLGGQLAYIVAPDTEHHIFVSEWKAAYPAARIIAPEGLPEKRRKQVDPKVNQADEFFAVLTTEAKKAGAPFSIAPDFDADFDVEFVDAHPSKEIVLFYRPERVVLQADLMFNLPAVEQYSRVPAAERAGPPNLSNRVFNGIQTTEGDVKWARRFMWYVQSAKDRAGFNESIRRIDAWDFVTLIPCHGETMVGDGKERFRRVFEWHLAGQKGGVPKA